MNHLPYFEGALDGFGYPTKTVKATCGKRVAPSNARMSAHIDCPACRAELQRAIANNSEILKGFEENKPGYRVDPELDARVIAACREQTALYQKFLAVR